MSQAPLSDYPVFHEISKKIRRRLKEMEGTDRDNLLGLTREYETELLRIEGELTGKGAEMEEVRQELKDQCNRVVVTQEDIEDRKEEIRKLNIREKDLLIKWTTNFNMYADTVKLWNVCCYKYLKSVNSSSQGEEVKQQMTEQLTQSVWYSRLMNTNSGGDEAWKLDDNEIQYGGYGEIELDDSGSIFGGRNVSVQRQKRQALLGEGQFGIVYKGVCRGTPVAIKELKNFDQMEIERLKNEARLMSTLNHPNILMFIGASFSDEFGVKLVVEYASNGSLESVIHPRENSVIRSLSIRRKLLIIQEIISAMDYLHNFSQPILHLDLKPGNILFDDDFRIKIADFGISQILRPDTDSKSAVVGTPGYMAPEILRREEITDKADVYSFGVIVYELWSGKYPFEEFNLPKNQVIFYWYEEQVKQGNTIAPVLEEGIKQIVDLVEMTTTDDPKERLNFREIADMNIVREAISEIAGEEGDFFQKFWLSIAPDIDTPVPWIDFLDGLIQFCELPLDYKISTESKRIFEIDCLYHALGSNDKITPKDFLFFTTFFQNIGSLETEPTKIIEFLKNLYLEKWWFGFINATEAGEKLSASPLKSCFLVRGSGRFPNAFVVSTKKKSHSKNGGSGYEIKHHGPFDCKALQNVRSVVKEFKKKKKVVPLPLNPGALMSGNPHRSKYVTEDLVLTSLTSHSASKKKK